MPLYNLQHGITLSEVILLLLQVFVSPYFRWLRGQEPRNTWLLHPPLAGTVIHVITYKAT